MRTALYTLGTLLLVAACGGKDSGGATEPTEPKVDDTNAATPVDAPPTDNGATAPVADPALIAKGAGVYEDACSTCHGDDGTGGSKSPAVKGASALTKYPTDGALFEYIKKEMPKDDPGSLSEDDYKAVIAWMRS